jgi:hypothetical protein
VIYRRPSVPLPLAVTPVHESWDKAGSASQLRLAHFLDHVEALVGEELLSTEPLALELVVGLSSGVSLTAEGRDLDNYLYPIARRLGHRRVQAVFGRKCHGESTIAVDPATIEVDALWQPDMRCRIAASGQSLRWKQEVAEACRNAPPTVPLVGPIALEIHYRLSDRRNWAQQWKPTIDALGAVLGLRIPHVLSTRWMTESFHWRCTGSSTRPLGGISRSRSHGRKQ